MARKRAPGYDPRKVWSTNLAPFVTAAREGASQAAETASKERARARRDSRWWRQRWLLITASGLVVAGAAGGVYQAVAKRRDAAAESGTGPTGPIASGAQPDRSTPVETIRSTVETGREKVTEVARNVLHKVRREEPEGPARESRVPESPSPNSAAPGRPATDRPESRGFVTQP